MKKLFYIAMAAIALTFVGCDENSGVGNVKGFYSVSGNEYYIGVEGEWGFDSYTFFSNNACLRIVKIDTFRTEDYFWSNNGTEISLKDKDGNLFKTAIYHPDGDYMIIDDTKYVRR